MRTEARSGVLWQRTTHDFKTAVGVAPAPLRGDPLTGEVTLQPQQPVLTGLSRRLGGRPGQPQQRATTRRK